MKEQKLRQLVREEASRLLREEDLSVSDQMYRDILAQLRKKYPVLGPFDYSEGGPIVVHGDSVKYNVYINNAAAQYDNYEVIIRDYSGTVLSATSVQDAKGVLPTVKRDLVNIRV